MMKSFFLSLLLLPLALCALGKEQFSYLYIQGDKQTPFYLKLDGAMQPRYGKNYCILPQLAPGPVTIEILFQQNLFPPEKFTVLIPDDGSRGFLLVKKDEAYALYDLQQGFYLKPGNAESEDHLPAAPTLASAAEAAPEPPPVAPAENTQPPLLEAKGDTRKQRPLHTASRPPKKPARQHQASSAAPAFISDIELGHEGRSGDAIAKSNIVSGNDTPETRPRPAAILNSDCPSAISSEAFGKIFNTMSANSSDEDRLRYILGRMDVCYASWQARALAQMLSSEAARYTLLKRIYSRISDQAAFPLLDDLFTTDTWKDAFNKLLNP